MATTKREQSTPEEAMGATTQYEPSRLYWTGHGALPGVPARDLAPDEVAQHGGLKVLLASGCYSATPPASNAWLLTPEERQQRTAAIEAAQRGEE